MTASPTEGLSSGATPRCLGFLCEPEQTDLVALAWISPEELALLDCVSAFQSAEDHVLFEGWLSEDQPVCVPWASWYPAQGSVSLDTGWCVGAGSQTQGTPFRGFSGSSPSLSESLEQGRGSTKIMTSPHPT